MDFDYVYINGKKIPISPRAMSDEEAAKFAEHNTRYRKIYEKQLERKAKYEQKLKLGEWIYCKYCYKNTHPIINWFDGLIKCGTCDAGLYPLQSEDDVETWIKNH